MLIFGAVLIGGAVLDGDAMLICGAFFAVF